MGSFWKKLLGREEDAGGGKGQYGVDYVGVAELLKFNRNLLVALQHETEGIDLYKKFLDEANDERGRERYRRLIDEERRHLRRVADEIEEHKKQGYWS